MSVISDVCVKPVRREDQPLIVIVKNLDVGVRGIIKKAALGRGGGRGRIIYKIVNFVMISIVFKIIF